MATQRTHQEWQTLFERYESSQTPQNSSFVKAHVVEQKTRYHMTQAPTANMTFFVNDVALSIPQGTPASYIAELIGVLS